MQLTIEQVSESSDFDRIAASWVRRIDEIGQLDYERLKTELQSMQRPLDFVFNPDSLARDMARVQGFKDRATEILSDLTENYLIFKRAVETLTKGWMRFSVEKSSEKREGEALLKLSNFSMASSDAEYYYRHALGIVKNLESQLESLSRQISCVQIAAKIHDPRFAYDSAGVDRKVDPISGEGEDRPMDWDKMQT